MYTFLSRNLPPTSSLDLAYDLAYTFLSRNLPLTSRSICEFVHLFAYSAFCRTTCSVVPANRSANKWTNEGKGNGQMKGTRNLPPTSRSDPEEANNAAKQRAPASAGAV